MDVPKKRGVPFAKKRKKTKKKKKNGYIEKGGTAEK